MPRANRHDNWAHDKWDEPYFSAWRVAIAPGDVFREGGPANKLNPRTVWNNERAFGRYREFLYRTGRRDDDVLPDVDNLRAFDAELAENLAPYSRLAILTQLTGALRLMFPDADLRYLNKVAARMAMTAVPARSVEPRLVDPISLIRIGVEMMVEVLTGRRPGLWDCNRFRTGALINAAAQFPLRLGNWQMMIIGQHVDLDTGRVSFTAKEMKRKKPFEGKLPPEVLIPLRIYVDRFRSGLLDPDAVDDGYLWPSTRGGICKRRTFNKAVMTAVQRRTGKAFNFHLFRHSAATFISETKPEQTRMAAGILHHSRLRMTDKHYIRGTKRRAFKLFQRTVREVIDREKRKSARKKRSSSPRQKGHARRTKKPRHDTK